MLTVHHLQRLSIGPIDLTVNAGEIVALTGPSGTGKSLLLRAIADLDPSEGEVSLAGQERQTMSAPDWRRQVMYVPAHAGWWADKVRPHFEGLSLEAVKRVLHKLDLESTALDWDVANLSTGERQRLALARAVAHAPKILLLDEPTSGLDADNANRAEAVISTFVNTGDGPETAVVFVTHDRAQAERLATRRVRLEDGQLHEVSS